MPENESQYELDENYEPLEIADKADGSGTTWPELVSELNKMNQQVAALTRNAGSWDSRFQPVEVKNARSVVLRIDESGYPRICFESADPSLSCFIIFNNTGISFARGGVSYGEGAVDVWKNH